MLKVMLFFPLKWLNYIQLPTPGLIKRVSANNKQSNIVEYKIPTYRDKRETSELEQRRTRKEAWVTNIRTIRVPRLKVHPKQLKIKSWFKENQYVILFRLIAAQEPLDSLQILNQKPQCSFFLYHHQTADSNHLSQF